MANPWTILPGGAVGELARRLEGLKGEEWTGGGVRRVEIPLPPGGPSLLSWLGARRCATRYYWHGRDDAFEMAGLGESVVLVPGALPDASDVFLKMRGLLGRESGDARFFGGFRFQQYSGKAGRWRSFTDHRFVLPLLELRRAGGVFSLAANLSDASQVAGAAALLRGLADPPPSSPPLPAITGRADLPDRAGWMNLVGEALGEFNRGALEKVVLARETTFEADAPFDPVRLLEALAAHTCKSFLFCFHPAPDRAFLGASPERLFRRAGTLLESEAVAGTRPRGQSPEQDAALREELLASPKDRREQALVVEALRERFGALCAEISMGDGPDTLELLHCRHLITRISGRLRGEAGDGELLARLHPTPAVGGTPTAAALEWLARREPFDRGIYAGPVGWVGRDGAEFCVAIRSGLVHHSTLSVYNGAGIVPGSDPGEEWLEIETKMINFTRAVGFGDDGAGPRPS